MEIQHYERARFLVTAHGETFTVDLLCYDGNGKCDCWPFIRKGGLRDQIERLITAGAFVPGPQFKCPHILAADHALLNLFKQQLLKQFPDNDIETT